MPPAQILVIEKSRSVRALVKECLRARGFDVLESENAAQALTTVERTTPDIVLLDAELAALDGYSVLTALTTRSALENVPVILLSEDNSIAWVVDAIGRGAHDFVKKPVEAAELVARVESALRSKSLMDELRRRGDELDVVSRTDVLTGLFNRRHLEEALRQLTSQARRYAQPFTIVMFDIDRLKDINDAHTAEGGDDVLRTIARRIRSSIRESDVVGRWGGEQFLALLPMTDLPGARTFAERIRAMIDWAEVVIDGAGTVHVTVSAGIAEGTNVGELLLRADEALYAAKKDGRNVVRTA
jgi:diguanylate cyclase (GGDEF)-like protein